MADVTIDEQRFRQRFDEFNEIGATDAGGVDRPTLSDENKAARDTLVEWFREAELDVRIDEMGNIFGRREGRDPDASTVLFGSHVDSQYNGGRYDGVVGVLGALEAIEALTDAGIETDRPLEIVAWSNEEGVRFQPDMLGSGVYTGVFDLEYAYRREDKDGKRFGDELERIGYKGEDPCEPGDLHCYFELHVEQGPFLEQADLSVGVVEGVFGFSWMNVAFEGQANHAGPTPMTMRRDAFVATADVTKAVREITATEGTDLVGTVGSVDVWPNSINVIPERVEFTIDCRSYDNAVVDAAVERVQDEIAWAAEREGLEYEFEEIMRVDADPFDDECIETVAEAADEAGCEYTRLVSGAGHDANYLNKIAPTSMIFVPSVDGISHRESEYTEWEDVVTGAEVLLRAVRKQATA
ncbi:Zn-dependent hydrolase [Natrinema salifodinae]|uniref:N-carbamoyl-L-amino-acid hydrolase n=1 Tax=Natrinema salifodinae TaxID=1202768 RepID=A0A1I0QRX5_9EURY|nr:Zn-dependent hydrolase [Natrinema salifodinae]SEW29956.1 N-carbamoyl-L-amino-acid hydrolase [Natrinema salifodinae]